MELSAVVRKEGKRYVSRCPELDVASQGPTIETALTNLKEAVELFLEDERGFAPAFRLKVKKGRAEVQAGRVYATSQLLKDLGL